MRKSPQREKKIKKIKIRIEREHSFLPEKRFKHRAKVPFVRRIMFELRLTPDILKRSSVIFNARPQSLTAVSLLSTNSSGSLFPAGTEIEKAKFLCSVPTTKTHGNARKWKSERDVHCGVFGDWTTVDVRMRGPAIDAEKAWDDQHSLFCSTWSAELP